MASKQWLTGVALAAALAPASAGAVTLDLSGGKTAEMAVPPGLCQLVPASSPVDGRLFEAMASLQRGINRLLAVFADCQGLEVLRSGKPTELKRWAIVLLQLQQGEVRAVSGSRATVVDAVARQMGGNAEAVAAGEKIVNERLKEILRDTGSTASIAENKNLGTLAKDDMAVFTGLLLANRVDGQDRRVAGVIGFTVIAGYPMTVNYYRPFVDTASFDSLLVDTRATVADLIARNDSGGSGGGFAWSGLLQWVIIGMVGGGLLGVAVMFWRRRQRSP